MEKMEMLCRAAYLNVARRRDRQEHQLDQENWHRKGKCHAWFTACHLHSLWSYVVTDCKLLYKREQGWRNKPGKNEILIYLSLSLNVPCFYRIRGGEVSKARNLLFCQASPLPSHLHSLAPTTEKARAFASRSQDCYSTCHIMLFAP